MGRLVYLAAAAALLAGVSTASAGMVFNLGTDAGRYSSPLAGTFQHVSTWTYGPTYAQWDATLDGTGTFQVFGITLTPPTGTLAPGTIDPSDAVTITYRFTPNVHQTDGSLLNYYRLGLVLLSSNGEGSAGGRATSSYATMTGNVQASPLPFTYSATFQLLDTGLTAGTPTSVNGTNGGVDFATMHVDLVQMSFQNGTQPSAANAPQQFSLQIEQIAFGQVPEPASLGLLAAGGLGLLLKRRR